jgi:hypothetical protein
MTAVGSDYEQKCQTDITDNKDFIGDLASSESPFAIARTSSNVTESPALPIDKGFSSISSDALSSAASRCSSRY